MLAPSGVGKSSLTKAMAEFLFGDERKGLQVTDEMLVIVN